MSKLARATLSLMIVSLIAKGLGFGRELVLASGYGAGMYSDAYITAMNIPTVIFAIIGNTLATVLIPMYMEVDRDLGEQKSLRFINNVFNLVVVSCVILSVLCFVFAEQIVNVFAMGYNEKTVALAISFTKISTIGIVCIGLSYVMTTYLQIKNNFVRPALSSIPKNVIIIASIILSINHSPYIMIWGAVIGLSSEFFFQLPDAIKEGYKYRFVIDLKDKYIKKMGWLLIPVFLGVAVNQVNVLVDRTLASTLPSGSVSALSYADKLNAFVIAIFISSISAVIYPLLSKLSLDENKERFTSSIIKSINSVIVLVLPISIGTIVLATPIVEALFQRGAFDERATYMTATALSMYSIGMVAFGLRDVLGKIFYSLQDTKTPMVNGVITMIMNVAMNFIFIKYFGLGGITLSTSLASIICILLLFFSLYRKVGYFGQDKIIKSTAKSVIASGIMGVVVYYLYDFMMQLSVVDGDECLVVVVLVGAALYGILIILFKVEEVKIITDVVKRKLKINSNK